MSLKDELIKAAGDLQESKARVMQGVLQAKPPKKPFPRSIVIGICVVLLLLVAIRFVPQQQRAYTDEETVAFYSVLFAFLDEENARAAAIEQHMRFQAVEAFAASKKLTPDEEAVQQRVTHYLTSLRQVKTSDADSATAFTKALDSLGYSWQELEAFIEVTYSRVFAAELMLEAHYSTQPTADFSSQVLRQLRDVEALLYYREHHLEQLIALEKKFGMPFPDNIGETNIGVVLDVTDHAFLFAPTDAQEPYYWLPIREGWRIHAGDRLKLRVTGIFSEEGAHYDPSTIGLSYERYQEKLTYNLNFPDVQTYLDSLPWQPNATKREPDIELTVNGHLYYVYVALGHHYFTVMDPETRLSTLVSDLGELLH